MTENPTRKARLAQAETVLRGHPDWSDPVIAQFCKLTEADVAEVRARLMARTA